MPHVIYDTRDTRIVEHPRTRTRTYKTHSAAVSARTKMLNKGQLVDNQEPGLGGLISSWFAVAEHNHYQENIKAKNHMVRNIMTGKMVEEDINTTFGCSVASENYWCS